MSKGDGELRLIWTPGANSTSVRVPSLVFSPARIVDVLIDVHRKTPGAERILSRIGERTDDGDFLVSSFCSEEADYFDFSKALPSAPPQFSSFTMRRIIKS